MTHQHGQDDTEVVVKKNTGVRTDIAALIGLIIAVALSVNYLNSWQQRVTSTQAAIEIHTKQLTTLETAVGSLRDDIRNVSASQVSQTELIKYIARDRKGPAPDSLK